MLSLTQTPTCFFCFTASLHEFHLNSYLSLPWLTRILPGSSHPEKVASFILSKIISIRRFGLKCAILSLSQIIGLICEKKQFIVYLTHFYTLYIRKNLSSPGIATYFQSCKNKSMPFRWNLWKNSHNFTNHGPQCEIYQACAHFFTICL